MDLTRAISAVSEYVRMGKPLPEMPADLKAKAIERVKADFAKRPINHKPQTSQWAERLKTL